MKLPSTHALLLALSLVAVARAASPTRAQDIVPDVVNQKLAATSPVGQNGGVIQTAYAGLQTGNFDSPPMPTVAAPQNVAQAHPSLQPQPTPVVTRVIPPANGTLLQPVTVAPPGDVCAPTDGWIIGPVAPARTSSWTAGIELLPMEAMITDGQFGRWRNNSGGGIRGILGYEDPAGYGLRGRVFGFGNDARTDFGDITLAVGAFNLDLYKRIFFEDRTELAIGFGPASGVVDFELDFGPHSRYEGGGVSTFAETFWPTNQWERSDLGVVGRARYSVLFGHWESNDPMLIPETENDAMSVAELAWGLEFRRRFGRCEDHHWYVGCLFEYQRWQSDWMSIMAGTSVGLAGLNINTGIVW